MTRVETDGESWYYRTHENRRSGPYRSLPEALAAAERAPLLLERRRHDAGWRVIPASLPLAPPLAMPSGTRPPAAPAEPELVTEELEVFAPGETVEATIYVFQIEVGRPGQEGWRAVDGLPPLASLHQALALIRGLIHSGPAAVAYRVKKVPLLTISSPTAKR